MKRMITQDPRMLVQIIQNIRAQKPELFALIEAVRTDHGINIVMSMRLPPVPTLLLFL